MRILLVEDEPIVAVGILNRLKKLGYEVTGMVTSGEDAILHAGRVRPDLVLMEIGLQGDMDGIDAAREIRARYHVPVVYLAAYADDETLQRAQITEHFGIILKPFGERDLRTAIVTAIQRHRTEETLKATRAELEYQKGFFTILFDSSPSPVFVVDEKRKIQAVNAVLRGIVGIRPEEAAGLGFGQILKCVQALGNPDGCGTGSECKDCQLRAAVEIALAGGNSFRNRAYVDTRTSDGIKHVVFQASSWPTQYEGYKLAVVILEDVNELPTVRNLVLRGHTFAGMVGRDQRMQEVFDTIRDVAGADAPVLIEAESGTGKELIANAIHALSRYSAGPFVPVSCGALPESLLESELFGHVKGAFTGAIRDKKGRFELAKGGTLFLDEIGDLSAPMQVKLLRVLQEGTYERVGDEKTLKADVRIVSATNKNLRSEVAAGRFREDLYYRLAVVPMTVPPLRERRNDIPLLAEYFLQAHSTKHGKKGYSLSPSALALMMEYDWPGNVRELQNALRFAVVKNRGTIIDTESLPVSIQLKEKRLQMKKPGSRKLTADRVKAALKKAGENRAKAAKILGVSRATLYRFLADSGR